MSFESLSSKQVLERLNEHPGDFTLLQEVARRSADPEHEVAIRNGMLELFGASPDGRATWKNCIGEQICHPFSIQKPKKLQDLKNAVATAPGQKLKVRAVGSGHSFSDVCPTDGILLDPHEMNAILPLDASTLKDPSTAGNLFSVESGITIADLNAALDAKNLALENMGAYDGQTVAGAISTGTHGTGISFGPIASSVRSVTIVASNGTVYQIEPSNGITDPAKFNTEGVVLKQDDDWFNTVVVSMGCTGIIYSYTLHVVKAFYISELRTLHNWEDLKGGLNDGATSQVLTQHRGYEIDINPYPIGGVHSCIQVVHDDTPAVSSSGTRGWANWLGGLLASVPLIEKVLVVYLNLFPKKIPGTIATALESLVTPHDTPYVDKSFDVLNIGTVVNKIEAYALELSVPCDGNLVANVDKLLAFLKDASDKGTGWLTGPVNLRFVAASGAFLAPQSGRQTCMIELDMLVGIHKAKELFIGVKNTMCSPGSGVRLHWGLDPEDSVTAADLKDWYPDFEKWMVVYKELNAGGLFNSVLTDRLGISV